MKGVESIWNDNWSNNFRFSKKWYSRVSINMWSTPAVWKQYNKMAVLHFFLVNSPLYIYSILYANNPSFQSFKVCRKFWKVLSLGGLLRSHSLVILRTGIIWKKSILIKIIKFLKHSYFFVPNFFRTYFPLKKKDCLKSYFPLKIDYLKSYFPLKIDYLKSYFPLKKQFI